MPGASIEIPGQITGGSVVVTTATVVQVMSEMRQADPEEARAERRETAINAVVRYIRGCSRRGLFGLLLIDTAETAQEGFTDALTVFLRRLGPANVAIVIAGRSVPDALPYPTGSHILGDLLSADADRLLQAKGQEHHSTLASDEQLRTAVIDRLGGHPEFLSIAAKVVGRDPTMTAKDFNETGAELTREELVARFLIPRHVLRIADDLGLGGTLNVADSEELLVWLGELSLPRWFDRTTAEALGHEDLYGILDRARDDLVRPIKVADRHALQFTDRIADLLRAAIHRLDQGRTQTTHARLAAWVMWELDKHGLKRSLARAPFLCALRQRLFRLGEKDDG